MPIHRRVLQLSLLTVFCVTASHAFIDGLYCGRENCYDVLGITRDTSKAEMARTYRQLARKYHPDMHKTQEAKAKAAERFTLIATAYEILKDDESRKDYDDMLDNPEAIYRHYYRYYRTRMAPKVDIRIVLAVTITVISAVQYYGAWHRYHAAIDHLITVPKYRLRAMEIAKKEGLFNPNKKKDRRRKEEIKEEEENTLKRILEEQVDIRGGYSKPTVRHVLWVQLVLLPYTIGSYLWWQARWFIKFNLRGEELGMPEKEYLIRRQMALSQSQWDALEERDRQGFFRDELWIAENFKVWKQKQEDEMKAKLAESARYKSYRRYMKNHGPGQITFED
ncbi:dnaJ homolog subfamily C member 25 homolog [Rhipicephalus sanguineus]|uniref:dnaJ homolog subfamily C member 25 homolog n=1 Tax=Rhipicephalus sanguineus TaxID=34632 RepID=UPI0018962F97|nr:dnaJ homolog subfamily C member 25 homolog [Rhipicephalus sanguineus]